MSDKPLEDEEKDKKDKEQPKAEENASVDFEALLRAVMKVPNPKPKKKK